MHFFFIFDYSFWNQYVNVRLMPFFSAASALYSNKRPFNRDYAGNFSSPHLIFICSRHTPPHKHLYIYDRLLPQIYIGTPHTCRFCPHSQPTWAGTPLPISSCIYAPYAGTYWITRQRYCFYFIYANILSTIFVFSSFCSIPVQMTDLRHFSECLILSFRVN